MKLSALDRFSLGFTLIELLVVLAIVAIFAALAAPSFSSATQNSLVEKSSMALMDGLMLARNEAMYKLTVNTQLISMCPSSNSTSTNPTCTSGSNWAVGWIVWRDINSDLNRDSNEVILRVGEPLTRLSLVTKGTVTSRVSFNRQGISSGTGTFIVCDGSMPLQAVAVYVASGPQLTKKQHDGSDLTCS